MYIPISRYNYTRKCWVALDIFIKRVIKLDLVNCRVFVTKFRLGARVTVRRGMFFSPAHIYSR